MGYSLRVAELMQQRAAERQAARDRARLEAAEFHRTHLNRERAAAAAGVSRHQLKRLVAAGRGPVQLKAGPGAKCHCLWLLEDCQRWRADPAAYEAARPKRVAELQGYAYAR